MHILQSLTYIHTFVWHQWDYSIFQKYFRKMYVLMMLLARAN